jgi:hypothetical protein
MPGFQMLQVNNCPANIINDIDRVDECILQGVFVDGWIG